MNESTLWEWLRDVVLPVGHYDRIEAPETAPGFPDVRYTIRGDSPFDDCAYYGTLELKYSERLRVPFPNEDSGLHKSQLRWIKKEVQHFGNVWIIAEIRGGTVMCIPGDRAPEFNGANDIELAEMAEEILFRKNPEDAAERLRGLLCRV